MEELTKRTDLKNTTLIKISKLFPNRGLLRNKKAWCPKCLQEMKTNGEIYEPLIWNISLFEICPEHNIELETSCPWCGNILNVLSRSGFPGYCSSCHHTLEKPKYKNQTNHPKCLKQAIFIKDLLLWVEQQDEIRIGKEDINKCLILIVGELFNNNIANAAEELGFRYSTFRSWYKGINQPPIEAITRICLYLNITIEEFLAGQFTTKKIKKDSKFVGRMAPRRRYDHIKIQAFLKNIIDKKINLSISKISEVVGCDRRLLSRQFPFECEKIKRANKELQLMEVDKRSVAINEEIENAFFLLLESEQYPSFRKMDELLGNRRLLEKQFRESFDELKKNNYLL